MIAVISIGAKITASLLKKLKMIIVENNNTDGLINCVTIDLYFKSLNP